MNKKKLEKTGTIYVECAVHGWMQGNVVVVDNPYYAVTDENGKFSIPDLPPGKYQVKIWHEYLGESTREITVAAKAATPLDADLKDLLAKKTAPPSATATAAAAANDTNAKAGNEVIVKMHELPGSAGAMFRFEPADLTIKVGTTVKWVNDSGEDTRYCDGRYRHSSTDTLRQEYAEELMGAGVMNDNVILTHHLAETVLRKQNGDGDVHRGLRAKRRMVDWLCRGAPGRQYPGPHP